MQNANQHLRKKLGLERKPKLPIRCPKHNRYFKYERVRLSLRDKNRLLMSNVMRYEVLKKVAPEHIDEIRGFVYTSPEAGSVNDATYSSIWLELRTQLKKAV